jgi:hypothetical protein
MGTMVWSHKETTCPQVLTQLYQWPIRILYSSNLLCHHPSYVTHMRDVAVIIHPDNFTSVATDAFDPSQVTDYIRLESELSFLHVKTTRISLCHRDRLRQVKLVICETRRQVASTRLEAIAGSDNPYSLIEVPWPPRNKSGCRSVRHQVRPRECVPEGGD